MKTHCFFCHRPIMNDEGDFSITLRGALFMFHSSCQIELVEHFISDKLDREADMHRKSIENRKRELIANRLGFSDASTELHLPERHDFLPGGMREGVVMDAICRVCGDPQSFDIHIIRSHEFRSGGPFRRSASSLYLNPIETCSVCGNFPSHELHDVPHT